MRSSLLFVLFGILVAHAGLASPQPLTASEQSAAMAINEKAIRARVKFLSSDLLEGRGPATRGDWLAQSYIATELEAMDLSPGAPDGGWLQTVPLVEVTTHAPKTVRFTGPQASQLVLKAHDDFIAYSGNQNPSAAIDSTEVVFVGYGIVAPEYEWDDFKDVDVRGKVLLVMNNDPENDPALFEGKTRLWYGRWRYKYEQAAQKGAAGVIIIHTTPSAAYNWQVVQSTFGTTEYELPDDGSPRLQMRAWATEDASRQIAKLGGYDLDALRASAERRDFKPVTLGVRFSIQLHNTLVKTQSANVIAKLEGSDRRLSKEAVVYSAHHDHLGMKTDGKPGEDLIYNGALDNASGVSATLAIAQAFKNLKVAPKRSIYFVFMAAEEQGLLGSQYFVQHPPLSVGNMAANLNIDGINIIGKSRSIPCIRLGKSSLDNDLRAIATLQGRKLVQDERPSFGAFYRGDQFSFAKAGVPAINLVSGTDIVGKPEGWGKKQIADITDHHYHQPSDEYNDSWKLEGAVEDIRLLFYAGNRIANAKKMPTWNKGDEFESVRLISLQEGTTAK